jgi:hypothetical protein
VRSMHVYLVFPSATLRSVHLYLCFPLATVWDQYTCTYDFLGHTVRSVHMYLWFRFRTWNMPL